MFTSDSKYFKCAELYRPHKEVGKCTLTESVKSWKFNNRGHHNMLIGTVTENKKQGISEFPYKLAF